jgi:hypothetical protein
LHDRYRRAGEPAQEIARPEFRPAASSFGAFAAAIAEIAAVQRSWRDFRIAQ